MTIKPVRYDFLKVSFFGTSLRINFEKMIASSFNKQGRTGNDGDASLKPAFATNSYFQSLP